MSSGKDENSMKAEETSGNETTLQHGFWIHDRIASVGRAGDWDFLPSCSCSVCGFHSERPFGFCPRCDALMDLHETDSYSSDPIVENEVETGVVEETKHENQNQQL